MPSSNRPVYAFIAGVICGGIIMLVSTTGNPSDELQNETLTSRQWIELAESIVIDDAPTPPASARLYAYVATTYESTLTATGGDTAQANLVTHDILTILTPAHADAITSFYKQLPEKASVLSPEATDVKDSLLTRMNTDNHSVPWDEIIPEGEGFWSGNSPFSPAAKDWQRWIITETDDITAPPPPTWNSNEHKQALLAVKEAAMNRTVEQSAAVNFWGGVPGTQAPAGIWQDRLHTETQNLSLTDVQYAFAQRVLAQAIADSFIECWEEKYTYWTARPSMDNPEIQQYQAMANPNFPSYTSGHSTISSTGATVLGALFPEKASTWQRDAEEARDSRLWAGIHFPYDNDAGFELGQKIGTVIVDRLDLSPITE